MPEKTEKRLKLTDKDFLKSEDDCDSVIIIMENRENEGERLLEDALDDTIRTFNLVEAKIETLESKNNFDEMRINDFFDKNRPPKAKTIKTTHGSFGYKTKPTHYSVSAGVESFQKAMEILNELEAAAKETTDPAIKSILKAEIETIRDTFTRDIAPIEKITFAIIRKNLKKLCANTLEKLDIKVTPEDDEFFVQFGAGTRSAALKAIRDLTDKLKKSAGEDSAA